MLNSLASSSPKRAAYPHSISEAAADAPALSLPFFPVRSTSSAQAIQAFAISSNVALCSGSACWARRLHSSAYLLYSAGFCMAYPLWLFPLFCQQVGTTSVPVHLLASELELTATVCVKAHCAALPGCP